MSALSHRLFMHSSMVGKGVALPLRDQSGDDGRIMYQLHAWLLLYLFMVFGVFLVGRWFADSLALCRHVPNPPTHSSGVPKKIARFLAGEDTLLSSLFPSAN